jgi:heat shock protein HtpX
MIWEQIRSNRIRSVVMTIFMGVLLLLIGFGVGFYFFDSWEAGLAIALIVWIIMSLIAYFQGDSILLGLSKAKKIGPDDHPRLYNVVEEMKIASGLPKMPDIYIIDDPAMNAFATGRDPEKASVAVTSGLLQKLNRDELQGVIGHEISHIKNRDVLLMVMCGVLLGTIVLISWYATRFFFLGGGGRSRRDSSGGGPAQIIIIVVALVLMILAPIIAQLIYLAISRKREYMADASSALYTRYPEGLASALEKLAASTNQVKSANKATAPMYIINPFRKKGMKAVDITSTHPPISERIRILRAMAGGSFQDYDTAYKSVKKTGGVMPHSTMLVAEAVPLRAASAEEKTEAKEEMQRARETSNTLWQLNKYKTVECQCGTKFRIPPGFKASEFTCPHCGRLNKVP